MSRGRKANTISRSLGWEDIFDKSQGFYLQYIIASLGLKKTQLSTDSANDLFDRIKKEKDRFISEKKVAKDKALPVSRSEEMIFEIPSNWIWCKLGDVFDVRDGTHHTPHYHQTGFPLVTSKNLYTGTLDLSNVRYISEADHIAICERSKVDKQDILFAMIGSIGNPVIVDTNEPFSIKNVALFKYYDLNLSEPRFLYFYLQLVAKQMRQEASGSLQPFVSLKFLRSFPFPLPPLKEQQMIVDFLQDFGRKSLDDREYFDAEIEAKVISLHLTQLRNNQISTELDHQLGLVKELRQAYLREAMQGKLVLQDPTDESAEILLEKIKAEKEKLVAEKRIKRDKPFPPIDPEELPFEIPSMWTWCRLGTLAEMCLGKMLDQVKNKGELKPYLRNVNVRWGSFDLSDFKEMRFTAGEEEKYSAYFGDLIICEGGEPGRAAIWQGDQPIKIQKAVHRVRTNKRALQSEYLYHCLLCDANSKRLTNYFTGGGIQHLTGRALSKYVIPLPPLAEQERIVAKLEKLMRFCDELEANIKQGIKNADQFLQTALKEALEPKDEKLGEREMAIVEAET